VEHIRISSMRHVLRGRAKKAPMSTFAKFNFCVFQVVCITCVSVVVVVVVTTQKVHTHTERNTYTCTVYIYPHIYRCISLAMHTNDLFIYLLIAIANDASFSMTQLPHVAQLTPRSPFPCLSLFQPAARTSDRERAKRRWQEYLVEFELRVQFEIYWAFATGHNTIKTIKYQCTQA